MTKNFLEIVLFGDSMAWSPGVAVGKRYADFIEEKISSALGENWIVDVAACGDGGNTAQEGFERLERDCISYQPHIVALSFGANDSIRAPDREQFKFFYRKIINHIKQNATEHIILETIPTLDPKLHSQRNNPLALFYGGLEAYVEFFSHSFIRETGKNENILVHDRFKIYHQEIEKEPELREKWIQKDGVHLTEQGNEFFAHSLVSIILPIVPQIHQVFVNAENFLQQAQLNPIYIDCLSALKTGNLKEYLSQSQNLKRLMLQKSRSFSRRAIAFSDNEKVRNEAMIVECFACGFMAAEKIFNTQEKVIIEKSRQWAILQLEKISDDAAAKKLIEYLFPA
ncbi:MAG: SGNH/GDSL hydrolase family protein [Candidatus Omnitrophica bacterium]|nr:SGNH/GDSL hydrolase family protein [Candidatus Omnitrophota bacterium]